MERQLLTSFIFLLFTLQSCQTFEVVNEPKSNKDISLISEKEVVIKPEPKDVWEYMIFNSSYEANENPLDERTLFFIENHLQDPERFGEFLDKSYYFIYYVIQELEAADLPVELALIPFIESNYDPFSISPSGAVGLWQFMPSTGRAYNLEKSWWNEDRHDPFRSTHAAIGYFKYLFERFDNDIYLSLIHI